MLSNAEFFKLWPLLQNFLFVPFTLGVIKYKWPIQHSQRAGICIHYVESWNQRALQDNFADVVTLPRHQITFQEVSIKILPN